MPEAPVVGYEELAPKVYALVRDIPPGRVATYGQLAALLGYPAHSRLVGRIMKKAPDADIPAHRVLGSGGKLSRGWRDEQRSRLEAEGVGFTEGGNVQIKAFQWRPFA